MTYTHILHLSHSHIQCPIWCTHNPNYVHEGLHHLNWVYSDFNIYSESIFMYFHVMYVNSVFKTNCISLTHTHRHIISSPLIHLFYIFILKYHYLLIQQVTCSVGTLQVTGASILLSDTLYIPFNFEHITVHSFVIYFLHAHTHVHMNGHDTYSLSYICYWI